MDDRFDVTIPEQPTVSLVPPGWAINVFAPEIAEATWEELDDAEGKLKGLASLAESYLEDRTEFEKALRLVEYRRGVLAGEPVKGRPADNVKRAGHLSEQSRETLSVWRKIAAHWETVVWPHLLKASEYAEVSQAAILRLIQQSKSNGNGAKPTPTKPDPAPRWTPTTAKHESADDIAAHVAGNGAEPDPNMGMGTAEENEPDVFEQLEAMARENMQLRTTLEALQTTDDKRTIAQWCEKYARLEGRLGQSIRTENEAAKDATYAKGMLAKIRKALGVEADRDILTAIADLKR